MEKALDAATKLFWRKGYDGTSLNDLTKAMGVTPPSFYFAFGNKEGIFRQVVDRYVQSCRGLAEAACDEPTAREVAARFLHGLADIFTDSVHAPGCLGMNSSLPCTAGDPIRAWLAEHREQFRQKLRDRFVEARKAGDIVPEADPDALARFVVVVAWGMAIEAQSGAGRKDLYRAIGVALAAWPDDAKPSMPKRAVRAVAKRKH